MREPSEEMVQVILNDISNDLYEQEVKDNWQAMISAALQK